MVKFDVAAHYPEVGGTFFGRLLSVAYSGEACWIASQMEKAGRSKLLLIREGEQGRQSLIVDSPGFCHQPQITTKSKGGVIAVWNEALDDGWQIKCLSVPGDLTSAVQPETIAFSGELCLPPAVAAAGDDLWVAWPAIAGPHIRIHMARKSGGRWQLLGPVSPDKVDAFRPSLAAGEHGIYLAWDYYEGQTYRVSVSRLEDGRCRALCTLSQEGERWFCPRLLAHEDGSVYLTWVVLHEVADNDLGIIDHSAFAMVARLRGDGIEHLLDPANDTDPRIIADFREGLLASKTYYSYFGLRRNPYWVQGERGEVWLLWDGKAEQVPGGHSGRLIGRRLKQDGVWSGPVILHSHRYAYAPAGRMVQGRIPTAFFNIDGDGLDAIESRLIASQHGVPYVIDGHRWQRWQTARIELEPKPREKVQEGDRQYSLYWADTHAHSVFSPDAEGEVDELIHFGRDVAGLDALCVTDNDCYPYKALTEAEWRVHQAFCTHYTQPGSFVLFPGWEYTYHRQDLEPDFNHRIVMYPGVGGKLYRRIDGESCCDEELFRRLGDTRAMCYPHHCTYRIVDPKLDWNVEVCSSWRVCLAESDFTMRMLQAGERLGFIGSSDSHRALPGLGGALTGVFADSLTPNGLFDAYRQRRTIATQGFFIFMTLWAGGVFIGGEGEVSGPPEIRATVHAPRDLEQVQVLRDGVSIHCVAPGCRAVDLHFADENALPGEHFYLLRAKLVGDPALNYDPDENALGPFTHESRYPSNLARARGVFAWTSPIWLHINEGPKGSEGIHENS